MEVSFLESVSDPGIFPLVSGLFGLLVGSFLNVVIHRLPRIMEREWQSQCAELRGEDMPPEENFSLVRPRSRCPACGYAISALENIPIVSWLLLRGKCSACRAAISVRYPLVEALTALLCALAAVRFGFGWSALGAMLLIFALIALSFIDFDTTYLPDTITLPLLWCGLLFNLWNLYTDLFSAVVGAMAGYLVLWVVYWGFRLLTGKEGMGYGDFKLLAALGAWLGWQLLPLIVLFSSVLGAFVGVMLIVLARHGRNVPIPFGPYLAAAGLLALFCGKAITRYYLDFISLA